jgi:hypothetical protein
MSQLTIKRLASGGVITNYRCVSRCGHCLYNCGPQRSPDYITEAMSAKIFSAIAARGCRAVHIGGGEPLLAPVQLKRVLTAAQDAGVGIDYVETSSAWFKDADAAEAVLRDLQHAGLKTLLVSISPFHNARIPFRRVRGVIEACRRTGIQVFPWVNAFVRDLERLGADEPHPMDEFTAAFGPDYLGRIPERCWIHLGGRALETFRAVYPSHPPEQILERSPRSCARALSDTTHFHVDLYGNYIPGLCAGLALAMEDLGRPLAPEKYPLLDRLAVDGIRGLYELARRDHGFAAPRPAYLNHCDLCNDIRGFLRQQEATRFRELAPEGFYRG